MLLLCCCFYPTKAHKMPCLPTAVGCAALLVARHSHITNMLQLVRFGGQQELPLQDAPWPHHITLNTCIDIPAALHQQE